MKLDTLEDLFEINHEKLKAAENKRVITKIKQLLKTENKSEARAEKEAKDYPYEAVSVVGNKAVYLRFDLDTKDARVVDVRTDGRDTRGRNHMVSYQMSRYLEKLSKNQKEK